MVYVKIKPSRRQAIQRESAPPPEVRDIEVLRHARGRNGRNRLDNKDVDQIVDKIRGKDYHLIETRSDQRAVIMVKLGIYEYRVVLSERPNEPTKIITIILKTQPNARHY